MGYVFEWDEKKAELNTRKHGVSFEDASTVFADPLSMLRPDPDHSDTEERFLLLGQSATGALLVVAFAERQVRTRIISARPATRRERRTYENEA